MTLEEFHRLDTEFIDHFIDDSGYRIEQYSAIVDGESRMIFVCEATGDIEIV